jgi:hypothetical protein
VGGRSLARALPDGGRRFFKHAFDSLLSLPVVVVLHQLGYAGRAPLVVVVVVMLAASGCSSRRSSASWPVVTCSAGCSGGSAFSWG